MALEVLKLVLMLMFIAGINLHFREAQMNRTFRNMYSDSTRLKPIDRHPGPLKEPAGVFIDSTLYEKEIN